MEVMGLCAACQRPGILVGCPACGANVHPECLERGRHLHGTMGGRGRPDHDMPKT